MDARRSPEGIGEGHGADELCDLPVDGRSSGSAAPGLPVPECAEALPVPANHGLGANHIERLAPPRPPLREPYPEESIEGAEPRALGAGRVAVVGPSSQERGPCGLPAQRAERSAERVRGALPSSLASLPTYVQRADRVLADDRSRAFLVVQSPRDLFWQTTAASDGAA
jgi:hypothetical protein